MKKRNYHFRKSCVSFAFKYIYTIFIIYHFQESVILANSTDPDETSRFAASHFGIRCLYMFLFRMHSACTTMAYFEF